MSVDFFPCSRCGESICDAGHYVSGCENSDCDRRWCTKACAKLDGFDPNDDDHLLCNFCGNQDVEDSHLLAFAIKKLGTTYDDLKIDCLHYLAVQEGEE